MLQALWQVGPSSVTGHVDDSILCNLVFGKTSLSAREAREEKVVDRPDGQTWANGQTSLARRSLS